LVGIALDKGSIKSVKQPILEFFPKETIANLDEQKRAITLEDLLTMSSGLDTKDSWLYNWVGLSKMRNSENWAQYILDLPMAQAPGNRFEYSNGVSHLLSAIIQKATQVSALEFAKKHLFGPLGITDVKWPTDPKGINIGYGQMMLTPHDMAKFGLLYLNKGHWDDRQIVSEAWVQDSTRKHISANHFDGYGYQWWNDSAQYYIDILWRLRWRWGWKRADSAKYYMASGMLGQFIFVVPEKNMVVVFTSNLEGFYFYLPKRLLDEYIIPAAVSSQPSAAQPKKKEHMDSLLANFAKAPAQGFIWTSDKNGVVKNGAFIRTSSPAFRFRCPQTSRKQKIDFPDQVMAMKTLADGSFSASISEIPAGTKLADVGPRVFASKLKTYGSNIQVISNKKITLEDGTSAYRTDINWKWQSTWSLRTLLVSAFQDGKWVYLAYGLIASNEASISENLKEGTSIVESLTFK